jgi:hypothetical protein
MQPTFDEPSLADVRQALERLIASGKISAVPATADSRANARIPASAGPVYRELATAFRSLGLPEAEIDFCLHQGEPCEDDRGGWRVTADPAELDVRLLPTSAANPAGDVIVDCSFSLDTPDEDVVHSTFLHFIVRAAVGNRLGD